MKKSLDGVLGYLKITALVLLAPILALLSYSFIVIY